MNACIVETEIDDPLQGQDSETWIDDQNSNQFTHMRHACVRVCVVEA